MKTRLRTPIPSRLNSQVTDKIALGLRLGLGSVFIAGGWWKLSRAIDPLRSEAFVDRYLASNGYINSFFDQYLFADPGALLTPLAFLTILSAFEFAAGIALLAGAFVRAISLTFAFMLWTFVLALPAVTAPGFEADAPSYFSPALLVQIRDIGLSGMCLVPFNLGSGAWSADQRLLGRGAPPTEVNWNVLGLVVRLSVAVVFIVGGLFAGYDHIKTFVAVPVLLVAVGVVIASGHLTRAAAVAAFAIVAWYCFGQLDPGMSAWDYVNSVKREVAYLVSIGMLFFFGGGKAFRPSGLIRSPMRSILGHPQRA